MKLQHLFESYSVAKRIFGQSEDVTVVDKYLTRYKELVDKNQLHGEEKDLTSWVRNGWNAFKHFIDSKAQVTSGKEQRRAKKGESLLVKEDDRILLVIPLTADASCFYGRQTKWCTASTKGGNAFNKYFRQHKNIMFYAIEKNTGKRMAAAMPFGVPLSTEFFDEEDERTTREAFLEFAGVTLAQMAEFANTHMSELKGHSNKPMTRDEYYKDGDYETLLQYMNPGERDERFEAALLKSMRESPDYANFALQYCRDVIEQRWPAAEELMVELFKNGAEILGILATYNNVIIAGPWDALEKVFVHRNDPYQYLRYIKVLRSKYHRKRYPDFEKLVLSDDEHYDLAVEYVDVMVFDNWPALEKAMYDTAKTKGYRIVQDDYRKYNNVIDGGRQSEWGDELRDLIRRSRK